MSRLIRSRNLGAVIKAHEITPSNTDNTSLQSAVTKEAEPPVCSHCDSNHSALILAREEIERLNARVGELEREMQLQVEAKGLLQSALETSEALQERTGAEAGLALVLSNLQPALPEKQLMMLLDACLENLAGERAFTEEQVFALTARVIEHISPALKISLSVSQKDYSVLKSRIDELEEKSGVDRFVLYVDESLSQGDVLATTDMGDWDGRLESRIATLLVRAEEAV